MHIIKNLRMKGISAIAIPTEVENFSETSAKHFINLVHLLMEETVLPTQT